ncbi:hypothetical protein [Alteromonas gracilis]|uniref:hypothetical protein n=1 Tax=Alteromonas gracilis TaxID=1479524 RepID=UPI0030CC0885
MTLCKFRHLMLSVVLTVFSTSLIAEEYSIYFVPSSTNDLQQGFLRFTNPNFSTVSVSIVGIDDAGNPGQTTLSFEVGSLASQQFNSDDLEFGNGSKGLTGFLGIASDNWTLQVTTSGELGVSSYIRTSEGFMTKIGDLVPNTNQTSHIVPMFNPASNVNQVSILRVVNISSDSNDVSILGIDDNGDVTSSASITLAGNEAVMLTAQDIENGTNGLSNGIGDGAGKWQLFVTSSEPAAVMSFLQAPGGYLSNLSKSGD